MQVAINRRVVLGLTCAVMALLGVMVGSASAGVLTYSSTSHTAYTFTASSGEANDLTISYEYSYSLWGSHLFHFIDANNAITDNTGRSRCSSSDSGHEITCRYAGYVSSKAYAVDLGDGNDTLETDGLGSYADQITADLGSGNDVATTGSSDDTIDGGDGVDNIASQSGNDLINVDGDPGTNDTVACGNGNDAVHADTSGHSGATAWRGDTVNSNCETVQWYS